MTAANWADIGVSPPVTHGQFRTRCPRCQGRHKTFSGDADRGLYQCFRCGLSGRIGGGKSWLDAHLDRIKKSETKREQERQDAARRAVELWRKSRQCLWHEYLRRKAVLPKGIRQHGSLLVVPMYDTDGHLLNCQTIDAGGDKRFLKGGRTTGLYYPIPGESAEIYVCEGVATGLALCQRFYPHARIAVAFSCGNLLPVAEGLRDKHPSAPIVVAADNDDHTERNPGLTKAREAAAAVGAKVVYPKFDGLGTSGRPTDFCDLHLLRRRSAK